VITALNHQEWRDTPTFAIDTSNRRRLFPIAWLNSLSFSTSIGTRKNHAGADLAHHKTSLAEVIKIAVHYTIFRPYILYQPKPRAN
jgi:hypothetical protein